MIDPVQTPWSLERILAGTDGSERSLEAVRQAARLSAAGSAQLRVAFVIDTTRPHDENVGAEAEETLGAARSIAEAEHAAVDAYVLEGDPGEELVREASEIEASIVCVGPDAGLLGDAIRIGRAADHVMRAARCSVLIARRAGDSFPERIVCAVDGSDASADTALAAAAIAAPTRAELRLIHVIPVFRGANREWTLDPDEPSPAELEASVLALDSRGMSPIREMAMGRPEHALVSASQRDGADLLIVGNRAVSGVRRLLGSVSEHVAHHASCSVMIVRSPVRVPIA